MCHVISNQLPHEVRCVCLGVPSRNDTEHDYDAASISEVVPATSEVVYRAQSHAKET